MEKKRRIGYSLSRVAEKNSRFTLIIILLVWAVFTVPAQNSVPLPSEEAPAALFTLGRDSPDVELFFEGYWKAQVTGSLGFAYAAGKGLISDYAFPGMETGFDFEQHPDLTLSVWLFQRYFLEAVFSEKWEDTTLVLGYRGLPGEFVRSVRLGNRDVRMDDYAFLSFPDIPENGLGITAAFATENTGHELLFRFDPTEKQTVLFRGPYQVEEFFINPGDYRKGRDFILPLKPSSVISDLEILVERKKDDTGLSFAGDDGRTYRRASGGTFGWDGQTGTLTFDEEQDGSVLIRYDSITMQLTQPIPDAVTGWTTPPTLETVIVEGSDYIVLYRPGEFSPLEANKFYASSTDLSLTETWRTGLWLIPRGNPDDNSTPLPFSVAEDRLVSLGSRADLPGTAGYSYPLLGYSNPSSGPDAGIIYGPQGQTDPSQQEYHLLLQVMTPVTEYRLERPLDGSVKVKINGVETWRFSVSDAGAVTFPFQISATDRVEITYRSLSSGQEGGDILFGMGNRFQLTPNLRLELGSGLRWNILGGTYTEKMDQNPGSILTSASLLWDRDKASARLEAGLSLSTGDTTGNFRLKGMEEAGLAVEITKGGVLPSGVPFRLAADFPGATRGRLLSKDYHSYTAFGSSVLNNYNWTPPASQIYPYADGSRIGPYTAGAANDGRDGQVLVIDYELGQNQWAGAQVPVGAGSAAPDLSSQRGLNFSWKWDGSVPSNMTVVVELGSLGEDLDGNGMLDEESSPLSDGFLFDDQDNGLILRYGGGQENRGNGRRDTEDTNGNGILDRPGDHKIIYQKFESGGPAFPDTSWKHVRIPFDEALREKLTSVSAIRVYLVNESSPGETLTGRLLVGDFFFEGSAFLLAEPSGFADPLGSKSGVSFSETYEGQLPAGERPNTSLESAYPEVLSTFHPGGETQKILRVRWDGSDTTSSAWNNRWEIKTYTTQADLGGYEEFSFYLRIPSLAAPGPDTPLFRLAYTDAAGRGLVASFPVAVPIPEWTKITVNLLDKTVSAGGQILTGAAVTLDGSAGPAATLTAGMENTDAGLVFLDEFHLSGSRLKTSGGVRGSFDYAKDGTIVSLGGRDVLRDFSFSASGHYTGGDFAAGFEESSPGTSLGGAAGAKVGIFASSLEVAGDVSSSGGDTAHNASHRLTMPFWEGRLQFREYYGESGAGGTKSFSRNSRLTFVPASWLDLDLLNSAAAYQNEGISSRGAARLNQNWTFRGKSLLLRRINLSLEANFTQSLRDWEINEEFYFLQWLDSFRYLVPQEGEMADRTGTFRGEASYNETSWGLSLLGGGEYASLYSGSSSGSPEGAGGRNQKNSFYLSLTPRFSGEMGPRRNWSFVPAYRRDLLWNRDSSGKNFSADLGGYFQTLGAYPLFFSAIPVWEIFAPGVFDSFRNTVEGLPGDTSYKPGYTLTLRRNTGSYLLDLFLPAQISFGQEREFAREGSVWSDLLTTRLNLRFSWINLFGRLGLHPRLGKLYDSEEAVTIFTYTRENDRLLDSPETHSLIIQNYLYFQGKNRSSLTLDNHFSFNFLGDRNWKESAVINWSRKRPGESLMNWPVIRNFQNAYTGLQHTETLELAFGSQDGEGIVSLLLKHTTGLNFTAGTAGVFISAGVERKNTAETPLYLIGLQTGLTVNFSF